MLATIPSIGRMHIVSRSVAACGLLAALTVVSAAAATADVAARDATDAHLIVRSEQPSRVEMERQFVAVWSPKVSFEAKVRASYNGEKARPALTKLFGPMFRYDYLTLQGRAVTPVTVKDNRATIRLAGVMVGVPVSTYRYHYLRDDGLWKFDWKRTCIELRCKGNLSFGY